MKRWTPPPLYTSQKSKGVTSTISINVKSKESTSWELDSASKMSGFRAVQPETRADRAAKQDKTTLEKSRLAQRKEKFIRYVDAGPPTEMQAGAVGFLPDADRFHSDTAGEEKRHRDAIVQRREDFYENKRNQVNRFQETDAMMALSVPQGKGILFL